jgi:hypothetical protein
VGVQLAICILILRGKFIQHFLGHNLSYGSEDTDFIFSAEVGESIYISEMLMPAYKYI